MPCKQYNKEKKKKLPTGILFLFVFRNIFINLHLQKNSYKSRSSPMIRKQCILVGVCVAQSVKPLTLDFGSGHDLGVVRSSSALGLSLIHI